MFATAPILLLMTPPGGSGSVAPELSSPAIPAAGTTLTATLSESGVTPTSGTGHFSLSGTAASVASWAISGTTLTLALTGTVLTSDTPLLSYSAGTGGIEGSGGTPMVAFTDLEVINGSAQATANSEGYYAKRAKMLLRAGPNNLASYSNLDNDTTTLDETNLQAAMNWADGYVDTRARVLLLTADTGANPHMLLTTNTFFDRVSDLASDIAVAYLYSARGFTGDTQQTVEGQMADMDAKARKELDEILDAARVTQAQDAGTNGAEVITVGGCASARCNVVLPVWGWW